MKQQMIKRLLVIIWGCFCLQMVTCAQVGVDKPAYVLYDNAGKAITYSQLIDPCREIIQFTRKSN